MGNIADLPVELLLKILLDESLYRDELYALSLLSRRLNDVALPIFLGRTKSKICESGLDTHLIIAASSDRAFHELDGLSGLRIALGLSQITNLSCTLMQDRRDNMAIVSHIIRLTHLIDRMSSVHSVSLHLSGRYIHGNSLLNPSDYIPLSLSTALQNFASVLRERGCESFCMSDNDERPYLERWPGDYAIPDIALDLSRHIEVIPSSNAHPRHGFRDFFRRAKRKVWKRRHTHQRDDTTFPAPLLGEPMLISPVEPEHLDTLHNEISRGAITQMHLKCRFLLLQPCLSITSHLILSCSSTLTHLTLSHIELREDLFSECLSCLAKALGHIQLKHLSLTQCTVLRSDTLLDFLRSVEAGLESLELGREVNYCGESGKRGQRLMRFPSLTTLNAPSDWVLFFLKTSESGSHTPLPKIQHLTASLRMIHSHFMELKPAVDNLLASLNSTYLSDLTLDLRLNPKAPWRMRIDCEAWKKCERSVLRDTLLPWSRVNHLILFPNSPPTQTPNAIDLVEWVSTLFRGVTRVTMAPPYVPQIASLDYKEHRKRLIEESAACLKDVMLEFDDISWKELVVDDRVYSLREPETTLFKIVCVEE